MTRKKTQIITEYIKKITILENNVEQLLKENREVTPQNNNMGKKMIRTFKQLRLHFLPALTQSFLSQFLHFTVFIELATLRKQQKQIEDKLNELEEKIKLTVPSTTSILSTSNILHYQHQICGLKNTENTSTNKILVTALIHYPPSSTSFTL